MKFTNMSKVKRNFMKYIRYPSKKKKKEKKSRNLERGEENKILKM